jgi:hypothetical protein
MFISSTRLLLAIALAAAAAAAAAAAESSAGQQTWQAALIAGSQQGYCTPPYVLVDDFTVVYHGDDFGAYPPVLFANASFNGAYLGGALTSAAGYAYGWTWSGTCLFYQQPKPYLLPFLPCNCNVNLQPAGGSDLAMYMACSICPSGACSSNPTLFNGGTTQCLANYKLVAVNASSVS